MKLYQLFECGDVAALVAHLKEQPEDVSRALQHAAQGERLDLLQCVLSCHPSQWDLDVGLDFAARRRGAAAFVRVLLAAGASPFTIDGHSPLWAAARAGDVESTQLLLAAGADPNAHTHDAFRARDNPDNLKIPLLAAIRSGVAAAVAELLDAGADVNVVTPTLRRPLDVAEELGDATIIHHLRERGGKVLGPEDLSLDQAARRGFVTRVRELLPTATAQARGDALVSAVQEKNPEVAGAIVEYGGIVDSALVIALGQCIAFDVPEVVPPLIAAGVDRDSPKNYYTAPPIVLAADRGRVSIVRDLLDAGVDLRLRDELGRNALAAARDHGRTEIVRMLRNAGATARTPAAIARATRQKLAASARNTWTPLLGGMAAAGDPSRFGGLPLLRSTESWPVCGDCRAPLTFFVQVDLSRTPKAAREAFGLGLLQLFHCTACNPYRSFSRGHQVRIVDPADEVTQAKRPEGAHVLPGRPITGWARAVKDYPYREADVSALLPDEREVVYTLNRQGDKLGGWPNWIQDPDYPRCPHGDHRMTQPILQIESDHGVAHTWGDNGAGFIVQCPRHRDEVTFLWQCA